MDPMGLILDWKKPGFRTFPVIFFPEIIPMIVNDGHIFVD
jgi:hypothetical protein